MKTLGILPILGKGKQIVLCHGDLTELRPEEKVDLLIVSALPNDYRPTPNSLIGALDRKGLSVANLALRNSILLGPEAVTSTKTSFFRSIFSPPIFPPI